MNITQGRECKGTEMSNEYKDWVKNSFPGRDEGAMSRRDQLQQETTSLNQQVERLQETLQASYARTMEVYQQRDAARREKDAATVEVAELKMMLSVYSETIRSLQDARSAEDRINTGTNIRILHGENAALKEQVTDLKEKNTELLDTLQPVERLVVRLFDENQELAAQLTDLKAADEVADEHLAYWREEVTRQARAVRELQKQLSDMTTARDDWRENAKMRRGA